MSSQYEGTINLEAMEAAQNYNAFLARLVSTYLPLEKPVLDFGAGIGTVAAKLREFGYAVQTLEPDFDHQAILEYRGFENFSSIRDLGETRFESAYSINVLEHVTDDVKVLQELSSALTQGARLMLWVPAIPFLYSSMDRHVGHLRRYRKANLKSLLELVGFHVDSIRYAHITGVPITLLYKAFIRKPRDLGIRGLKAYDKFVFPLSLKMDVVTQSFLGQNLLVLARKV